MDELSEEDKLTVARARKIQRFLSQPFQVAEVFTGHAGKLVTMEQTIAGFTEILSGKYDHLPEVAFYMVGDISEVMKHFFSFISGPPEPGGPGGPLAPPKFQRVNT